MGLPAKGLPQPPNCLHFQDLCLWTLNTGRGNCMGCTAKSSKSRRSNPYAAGGKACCPGSCRTQVQFVALLIICKVCLRTSLVVELRASATANEYMFNLGMASGLKQHVHCRVVIGDIELMVSTTTLRFRRYLLRNPATPVIHAIT